MQFFGILSRHFVEQFFGQLSRPALHVYAYLRTWCTSRAGQASDWVPVRVARIAEAIGRCTRQVRRGLAELRAARLVETEAVFEEGSQRANRLRILPEPGFVVDHKPEQKRDAGRDRNEAPEVDAVAHVEVDRAADEVVEALPSWAEEALEVAVESERQALELVSELEAGTADPEAWGVPGSERYERVRRDAGRMVVEAQRDAAEARAAAGDLGAAARVLWRVAVSTATARAHRALTAAGVGRRDARKVASEAACEAALRRALARRGVDSYAHTTSEVA